MALANSGEKPKIHIFSVDSSPKSIVSGLPADFKESKLISANISTDTKSPNAQVLKTGDEMTSSDKKDNKLNENLLGNISINDTNV